MKILSIGDIHGYSTWKKLLNYKKVDNQIEIDEYDKIIFVGDYCDDYNLSDNDIYDNLLDIIELKKIFPDKVILLFGNHDVQYLLGDRHLCSGFRSSMYNRLKLLFKENRNLFQLAYQINNYLWTHAGVHVGFYKELNKLDCIIQRGEKRTNLLIDKNNNLANILNFCFDNMHDPIFDCGWIRGGKASVGGPLWCDFSEIYKKPLKGYHQIVGHNRRKMIEHFKNYGDKNTSVTFIDCLQDGCEKKYIIEI